MTNTKAGLGQKIVSFIGNIFKGIRNTLGVVVMVIILIAAFISISDESLEPIPEQGALYLAPEGLLVDQKTYIDPFNQIVAQGGQEDSETLVRDVIEAINTALSDDRITHILLDTDYLSGASMSKLEEIGSALKRFKAQKPIIAVGDSFMASQYFLAAHADEILINPMGEVMITGLSSYRSYFKEALDKLKITMNIFRAGEFKSAVEPLMGNSMSPQVKEETKLLLGDLWQFYSTEIEQLRDLEKGTVDKYVNNLYLDIMDSGGDTAQIAKAYGLVDVIASRTEIYNHLNNVIPGSDGEFSSIAMKSYLLHSRKSSEALLTASNKIAVVIASGSIMDGQQPEGSIGGDTLAGIFANLRDDDQVKSIVLRIDSGGGSAFASEIIRDSINETRKKGIPVVVSMSSTAASGGYWIAAEADRILALSTTVTGSIGVWGVIPSLNDSLTELGIYSDGVSTSETAFRAQIDQPLSEPTKSVIQASVDRVYSRFLNLVASGRDSSIAQIHELAQGRVWTGNQALANGLVDELGDLNDAIEAAAELANLDKYKVIYPRKEMTPFESIVAELSLDMTIRIRELGIAPSVDSIVPKRLRHYANQLFESLDLIDRLNDPKGIYLYCDKCPI